MEITIREPGSAITHFIGMLLAVFASVPLLLKAGMSSGMLCVLAMSIFMCSMILLYGASTLYHSVMVSDRVLKIFRKADHMMIFVLIAGSYTPVCLIVLGGKQGYTLLAVVWGIAIGGMLIVFICDLYFNGMGLCSGLWHTSADTASAGIFVAACRRYHLYHWRYHLCAETAGV